MRVVIALPMIRFVVVTMAIMFGVVVARCSRFVTLGLAVLELPFHLASSSVKNGVLEPIMSFEPT